MTIDDYDVAISLNNRLEASIPFNVRPGKQLLKNMKAQGKPMRDEYYEAKTPKKKKGKRGGFGC